MSLIRLITAKGIPVIINTKKIILVDEIITKSIKQHSRIFMDNDILVETELSISELSELLKDTDS